MLKKILLVAVILASILLIEVKCQSSACQQAFCAAMLQRHNQLRSKHGAPALSQDATLNQNAQAYAIKLARADSGLVHSGGRGYGENLAYIMDSRFNGADVATCKKLGTQMTDNWYNEVYKPGYNFNNPNYQPGAGHFTQVVWVATNKIGCGVGVTSEGNAFYGVAQYKPPGNVLGQFQNNVLPAQSKLELDLDDSDSEY